MKVSNLTNSLLVLLLFSVTAVEAENKYPATDFQPKVVYQDSNYKHSGSSAAASTSSRQVSVSDSNYPAANFQPEVLFQDNNYKHTKGSLSNASASEASAAVESSESSEASSSSNMLLGLMLIAVAGFLFYKKGNEPGAPAKRKAAGRKVVAASDAGGASGVARYIESKAGPLVSGVAKYLEERESVAASGVAKYVAKQKVSARQAEAENASGVEKYLRDRG